MIKMTERLSCELQGLEYLVSLYWGSKSPTIEDTVSRAKALLENSDWSERFENRKKNQRR